MRARVAVDAGLGVNPASSCADSGSSGLVSVPPPHCPPRVAQGVVRTRPLSPVSSAGRRGQRFRCNRGGGLRVDALIIGGPARGAYLSAIAPRPVGPCASGAARTASHGLDGARATEPPGGNGAHSRDHEWSHGATGRKPRTTGFSKCQRDQLRGHGATRACCGGSAKGREEMPQATSTANQ